MRCAQCGFHSSISFDVLTAFPCDIMHDMYEGIIPVTLQRASNNLIQNCETLAVKFINDTIDNLKLINAFNHHSYLPENITSENSHISGTAIQNLKLFM